MLAEVSAASLAQDLTTKARLYARAHIPEYWVLDVTNRCLHVHRDPAADGYGTLFVVDAESAVEPQTRPGLAHSHRGLSAQSPTWRV